MNGRPDRFSLQRRPLGFALHLFFKRLVRGFLGGE